MRSIGRRGVLLLGTAGLAVCGIIGTTKTNGVTMIMINTASVMSWAKAFESAANLITTLPGIAGTPTGATIGVMATLIAADTAAFAKATGGALMLTFDSTSAPAAITSLLADGEKLLAASQAALGGVASSVMSQAQLYVNALSTIAAIFQAAMGTAPLGASERQMTEADAMTVLHVR